jgi:hypothetical protein
LGLDNFKFLKVIGTGLTGKLILVEKNDSREWLALRAIKITDIQLESNSEFEIKQKFS